MLKFFSMAVFTFIENPVVRLHKAIPSILPGIEKMVTVNNRKDQSLPELLITEKSHRSYTTRRVDPGDSLGRLRKLMQDKTPYDWTSKERLPFEVERSGQTTSPEIFHELKNVVLLLKIPVQGLELNDLIFLYLNENQSNFGITKSSDPLTTDNKSIIAFLLRNMIMTWISEHRHNQEVHVKHSGQIKNIIETAEAMRNESRLTAENYGLSLVKLCQEYFAKCSERSGRNYTLSEGAISKIKSYRGDLKNLENIINSTVEFIDNLYGDSTETIEVLDWHFQMGPDPGPGREADSTPSEDYAGKYSNTVRLLDRLESAALKLKSRNLKMTGTNVGNFCETHMSPPAISDALRNHRTRIISLIKMYPGRWNTIYSEFRPVRNLFENN